MLKGFVYTVLMPPQYSPNKTLTQHQHKISPMTLTTEMTTLSVLPTQNFDFSQQLLQWFDVHGRHDLPWQCANDPYKVWVSEIMLQQTQVKTVLQYFSRFMARFPTVAALAQASWEDVSPYWAGLGYYARARNLHKAAQLVHARGAFPQDLEGWMALPGIGRSTAGALMSLGLRQYGVILDGNVKRVLARFFAIQDDLSKPKPLEQLWQIATALCPTERNADYTQAIMDLGATICTPKNPLCLYCPMQQHCQGYAQGIAAALPIKKSKAAVPTKHSTVVILQCQNGNHTEWLWQLRPDSGLWGGLLSLPITSEQPELGHKLSQMALYAKPLDVQLKHSFTHFTWQLAVEMFHVEPEQQAALATQLNGVWLSVAQAQQKALPTAMKKLISLLKT